MKRPTLGGWSGTLAPLLIFVTLGAPVLARPPAAGATPSVQSIGHGARGPLRLGRVRFVVSGSGFEKGATVKLGSEILTARFVSSTKLVADGTTQPSVGWTLPLIVTNADGTSSAPLAVQIAVSNPKVSYAAAVRFLEQASFGPDPQSVAFVQQNGFDPWLESQQAATVSNFPAPGIKDNGSFAQSAFLYNAMTGPDQLRQRMAFALAQIFVVSGDKLRVDAMVPYLNLLQQNAFGNYRDVMQAVTLSPSMGHYLDMVNNDKPNPKGSTLPNENYARELMQLFTIGTALLNQDGSPQLDGQGLPIPTYTQTDIQNMARVFTGWTYPTQTGQTPKTHNPPYYIGSMIPVETNHDTSAKTVLGHNLPPGRAPKKTLAIRST